MDDDPHAGSAPRRVRLAAASRPVLARHVKLRHDPVRGAWIVLAPERILTPSETAMGILRLCDGSMTLTQIAAHLAQEYDAPQDEIFGDVQAVLQDMADKGYVVA